MKSLTKGVIAVIDDEVDVCNCLSGIFTHMGYKVVTASTSEEVGNISKHRADITFMDVRLGRKSGTDLCTELKQETPGAKVILMSGYEDLEEKAQQCKADSWLQKPFDINKLLSAMKKIL